MGLLNIFQKSPVFALENPGISKLAGMVKKVIQQGHSHFDARSVLPVREHGKRARTPLVAFFNIPFIEKIHLCHLVPHRSLWYDDFRGFLRAGVAQSVEQRFCKPPVGGSIPLASSKFFKNSRVTP